ncbi:RNA-directed DNA polymerase [Tanacetum coccineum]
MAIKKVETKEKSTQATGTSGDGTIMGMLKAKDNEIKQMIKDQAKEYYENIQKEKVRKYEEERFEREFPPLGGNPSMLLALEELTAEPQIKSHVANVVLETEVVRNAAEDQDAAKPKVRKVVNHLYNVNVEFDIPNCPFFKTKAIIDTGASSCFINKEVVPKEALELLTYSINVNGLNSKQPAEHKVKAGTFAIEGNKFRIPLIYAFDMKINDDIQMLIGTNFIRAMQGGIRIEGDEITIYKKVTKFKTTNQAEITQVAIKELDMDELEYQATMEEVAFHQEVGSEFRRKFEPVIKDLKSQGYIGEEPLKHWKKNGELLDYEDESDEEEVAFMVRPNFDTPTVTYFPGNSEAIEELRRTVRSWRPHKELPKKVRIVLMTGRKTQLHDIIWCMMMVVGCRGTAASRERGEMVRVRASGYGDRVDPVTRSLFGLRRKSPPEKFSGGGGGGRRRVGREEGEGFLSDSEHSIVSYTSILSNSDPSAKGIPLMDAGELPEMDPYEEVAQQGHAAPPSPAYVPDPMEFEHHVPVYVLEPVYPEYLVTFDDDIHVEDPEEDLIDYAADADDDEDEEEDSTEDDDDDENKHLALADSTDVASPAIDLVPSAEDTEPFKTDESAATPPPPAYRTTSRMSVRTQTPIPFPSEAEVARLLALPTPPPSPLTPLSLPHPQIPSPPLPLPSPPTYTSPTYAEAPLGYKAVGIQLRAASPLPLHAPSSLLPLPTISRREDVPEADVPPRKRLCLNAPTPRFEVGESSAAVDRQPGSTVAQVVNLRVSYQADVRRRESEEFYKRHQDAQRDRVAPSDEDADDHATRAIMRIQALEAGARVDTLEDIGSSA